MQGCILNVLGGGLLGIGTLFNLLLNGFCFADVCCRTYKLGMSITDIFALTLPHSFELIGFWISGSVPELQIIYQSLNCYYSQDD